jgi:hypothetical protein
MKVYPPPGTPMITPQCGNAAGREGHYQRNERMCAACLRYLAGVQRRFRNRYRCAPGLGWPACEDNLLPSSR